MTRRVSLRQAVSLLRRALPTRLRSLLLPHDAEWRAEMSAVVHDAPEEFRDRFAAAGYKARYFFPHQARWLRKCGPDGYKLAMRMCGIDRLEDMYQIVLHATPSALDGLPEELFFDKDIVWHEQHLGLVGQVASVNLQADGKTLYTMVHQSDLVQRISRRREWKTRVENRFAGWHHLLLNAVGAFALERGFRTIRVPTASHAMQHTDPARTVQPELFHRVHDRCVNHHFRATQEGPWWSIDVAANRAAIVVPLQNVEVLRPGRTVCICHDTERGLGHRDRQPEFGRRADVDSIPAFDGMLAAERAAGVRTTYDLVGVLFGELRERIERDGHALAFHTFDHVMDAEQLARCRTLDYRLKGYRPARSTLTSELRPSRLAWHNLEWLASSASSLRLPVPALRDRIAWIPIRFDDFPLHMGRTTWDAWRRMTVERIRRDDFVAFGLHDCYASHWLPHYPGLLKEIATMARFRTADEIAAMLHRAGAL